MARVLINAVGAEMGGALRHLANFLPALGEADSRREYVVLVRQSIPDIKTAGNIRLERQTRAAPPGPVSRVADELVRLPMRLRREKFAALVSLLNFGPVYCPAPHILFQRNSLYFCPAYLENIRGALKIKTAMFRRLAAASMKRADIIVTPSHSMAGMIRAACPRLQSKDFSVLPHGWDASGLSAPLEQPYSGLLARGSGYKLLYPTHPAPHKGFPILFEALALLKKRGVRATLYTTIDRADWPREVLPYERQIAGLGLSDSVIFLGRVPQAQMGALYLACDLMVYPSLCESFGFSMIESMGLGLPIVAAATDLNREMCGEAALYYSPRDSAGACAQIAEALMPQTAKYLVGRGQARLAETDWSWQRYARDFTALVGRVC